MDPAEETGPGGLAGEPGARRPAAWERRGFLEKPSPKVVQDQEQKESATLQAETDGALVSSAHSRLELARIRREQRDEDKAVAADRRKEKEERQCEKEMDAEFQRDQAAHGRAAEKARQEQKRRKGWLEHQVYLARCSISCLDDVPYGQLDEARQAVAAAIPEAMADLSPDSSYSSCEKARKAAKDRALLPYRREKIIDRVLDGFFGGEIAKQLDTMYDGGHHSLGKSDRRFLAKKWEPQIREELQRAWNLRGGMSEEEVRKAVRDAVERKLYSPRR